MHATRFAPSPTGQLHLGHAWSALVAHDVARDIGGQFRLRIDDLDSGRVRGVYVDGIVADLDWLGLTVDGPPVFQSQRLADYAQALDRVRDEGLAYPCFCTRGAILAEVAASVAAPHGPPGHGSEGPVYPGTCRLLDRGVAMDRVAAGEAHCWRLDLAVAMAMAGSLDWRDGDGISHGVQPAEFGDIVLYRRDGAPAYHLASTVDDAAMAISHVVRGADLFTATHIHRLLQALLGLPTPVYIHHRLIGDGTGKRLAKRHDAASIAAMRAAGVDPVALVADLRVGRLPLGYRWSGA
jgi:glutamyl-Q tRNA(Asp) synthetase